MAREPFEVLTMDVPAADRRPAMELTGGPAGDR